MIQKLLRKNIQISYKIIGALNQNSNLLQDGLYRSELKIFLLSFSDQFKNKKILDVGSGSWVWTKNTFSQLCDITTFDIASHDNVDIVGDIYRARESFPVDTCFDVIIATDVFEHVAEPKKALREILTLMHSGGLFVASTPFQKCLHGEEYGDYWRITRQGWKFILEKVGMGDIKISWLGEELFPTAYFISARKL